jgi:hypothetical protein
MMVGLIFSIVRIDWQDIPIESRLLGEYIAFVKTEPQMQNILAVESKITPEHVGFPFADHAFKFLDMCDILFPGILSREIIDQFVDPVL